MSIRKSGSGNSGRALQRVTRQPKGEKRPPIANDPEAQKAQKLLRATYRIFKRKGNGGWRAVARRFGLKGPGQAMLMAQGERPVCDRMREVVRLNSPRLFRRHIRKIVVPFLEKRQTKSKSGCYARGGRPVEW